MRTFREGQSSAHAAGAAPAHAPAPGKSTLSERLPVQRKPRHATPDASPVASTMAVQRKPLATGGPSIHELFSPPAVQMRGLGTGGGTFAVQRKGDIHIEDLSETTDTGNKYMQELHLNEAAGYVQIHFGIHWVKQGTWTDDATFQAFIRSAKTAVYGYVDDKFQIVCTPDTHGAGTATPRTLAIDFLLYDIDTGYKIECFGNQHGRSGMTRAGGMLYELGQDNETKLPPITVAHEFGHCLLGMSDEYVNPSVPGRTLTDDHSIMADYDEQGAPQAEFKARHFDHILKAVAAQYPGYTCSLR